MTAGRFGALGSFLAWMALPAVPVVLESAYNGCLQITIGTQGSPDPHDWGWFAWVTELGPLLGFGFLAGATLALPDEPTDRRWPRSWFSRRWFWVAVGPWSGFLVWAALVRAVTAASNLIGPLFPDHTPGPFASPAPRPGSWPDVHPWLSAVLFWVATAFVVATLCYGWLGFAYAAVRRARRSGTAWRSVRRGVAVAAAFAGSLFGGFWAVTQWWRAYFFDTRVFPAVLAALTLAAVCGGCGGTITYGEVRRRELFHAMLLAWTFGLALLWRWGSRPGPKPPPPDPRA